MGNGIRKRAIGWRLVFEWMDVTILVIVGLGVVIVCWNARGEFCVELTVGYLVAALICVAQKVRSVYAALGDTVQPSDPPPHSGNQVGHTEVKNKTKKYLKRLLVETQSEPSDPFVVADEWPLNLFSYTQCPLEPPLFLPEPVNAAKFTATLWVGASIISPEVTVVETLDLSTHPQPIDELIVTVMFDEDTEAYKILFEMQPP